MGQYDDLRKALTFLLTQALAPMPRFTRGRLGNGLGRVAVTDRPDYSYVRPSQADDAFVEVFNKQVSGGDGTPILIGEFPWQPGLTQVVGIDWEAYAAVGWGDGYAGVARHGETHLWRDGFVGTDTFNIFRRQIAPLRTYPAGSGSMSVFVAPYDYWSGGSSVSWSGLPALDLTAARPATGTARRMLTYLDMESNVCSVVTGTLGIHSDAVELDRPDLPTGSWLPSAYVRVYGGQGTISERDIDDARQLWAMPGTDRYVLRSQWLQNGFLDAAEVSLSWDDASRTLTVSPAGTSFTYLHDGLTYTQTSAQTNAITDTEGLWIFYFDAETLTSVHNPSEAAVDSAIRNETVVAFLYWDATNNDGRLIYELHGALMSPETHRIVHDAVGALFHDGMALSDFVIDDDGDDDEDAQFSVATGEFYDEDILFDLATVSGTYGLEIWYLDTTNWRWTTNAGFSILTAGSGRMAFNDAGGQTEVTNNNFALCHVFATSISDDAGANPKYIAIQGQSQYITKAAARAGADTEINDLVYGVLPLEEIVPIATVIFQTANAYGNSVKSRTVTTAAGDNYVDWRGSNIRASGGAIAEHGALAGLGDDDHQQYLLVAGGRGAVELGIGTDTVPHAGVGLGILALEGPDSSDAGPHIQVTTDADDYPLIQWRFTKHDDMQLSFDAYNSGAGWVSSDPGSNFQLIKDSDTLSFDFDSGNVTGSVVTWAPLLTMYATGRVSVNSASANYEFDVEGNIGLRGGAANTDRYIYFASDAYIFWDESEDAFIFPKDVGIGIAPDRSLHVFHSSADAVARFESGDGTCYIQLKDSNTTADNKVMVGAITDSLRMVAGGAQRATILDTGNFGVGTTAPGQIFDVNQGSGNMIADGYDNHSLAAYKRNIKPITGSGMVDKLKAFNLYEWTRLPFVSTNEVVRLAAEHFKLSDEIAIDARAFYDGLAADNPIKLWIDAKRVDLQSERSPLPEWTRKHTGLVADDADTVVALGDVIGRDDGGNVTGYSLNNYVGFLHGVILELASRVETLEGAVSSN